MNTTKGTSPDERRDRLEKIKKIADFGWQTYAEKYDCTHTIAEARNLNETESVKTAGRVMSRRDMGKIAFVDLQDETDRIQAVFRIDLIGEENFKNLFSVLDVADHIGVSGEIFKTQKGELSILVKDFAFLSKALRPLPDKWHGIQDDELQYRKRYLQTLTDKEVMNRFKFRSDFIKALREYYWQTGFREIDTPVLGNSASGALAKPFITHYNALDLDVYLRIAPEIHLKEAIIGGFDRVFEIARVFRNEGMDSSHLQEFNMLEHYAAYWNFEDNMQFTRDMLQNVIQKTMGTLEIEIPNRDGEIQKVSFAGDWPKVSFKELLEKDCGINIDQFETAEKLLKEIENKKIDLGDKKEEAKKLGRGNLIDLLYKKVSRPKLINPVFLINHPIDLSPLARKNDENPQIADRFQLVINGWEVVNAYSELIDPIDQALRFDEQAKAKEKGDEEALSKDEEYVEAMEHGMPPVSGWGMGIERILALLTGQPNLRDVVMFPLLRPKGSEKSGNINRGDVKSASDINRVSKSKKSTTKKSDDFWAKLFK